MSGSRPARARRDIARARRADGLQDLRALKRMNLTEHAQQLTDGAKTIGEWLGAGAMSVPQRQAQARANTCLSCADNIKGDIFTGAVADIVRKQIELKNSLQLRVSGERSLGKCRNCGCVLRLKVHVPLKNLGLDATEIEKFPAHCWQRTEFTKQPK